METSIFDSNKGLGFVDNDMSLYNELLDSYLTDNKFDFDYFKSLIQKDNLKAASYIHRIKGASVQIGADKFYEIGQNLEDVLKDKKTGDLQKLATDAISCYKLTIQAIINYQKLQQNS